MYGVWDTETGQWYRVPCGSGGESLVFATPSLGVAKAQTQDWQIPFKIMVIGDDGMPVDED